MAAGAFVLRAFSGAGEDTRPLVRDADVRAAAAVLFDPAYGVQIQGLPHARWVTCAGGDPNAVVRAAHRVADGSRGVYYTLHPCDPGLDAAMTSKAALRRRWLLVDVDAGQGKDLNATDAEHEAARLVAYGLQVELMVERGWPAPVVIDSGNGWHLLWRVDLPNDDASRVLCRRVLAALADQYDSPPATVDRKTHDARRISKLPGTLVRKGPADEARPWRWARLVFAPDSPGVVTVEQLREVAGGDKPAPQVDAGGADPGGPWTLRTGQDRTRAYARSVMEREEARVILAPQGERNDTLNRAAFALGTLVAAGAVLEQEAAERLIYAAGRNGLDRPEAERTVRSGLEAGKEHPRDLTFLSDPAPSANGTGKAPPKPAPGQAGAERPAGIPAPQCYTMSDLMALQLPPPKWVVPGLLSEGLNILAGKPKLGKSWLALNLALTIAVGGKALGDVETVAGDVLYLSLEDRLRRVQDRARKVLGGLKVPANGRLTIAVEWLKADRGGLWQLMDWLEAAPSPRLVIVDVWARFRTPSVGRRSAYDEDYDAACEVKGMVDRYGASLLVVHHCKKGKAEDVIEEVSGTLGLSGAADGVTVLTRARCDTEATLHVTGRDVDEKQLALKFDPATCCWTSEGDAKLKTASKTKERVFEAFRRNPGTAYWPSELAQILDVDRAVLKSALWKMAEDGLLKRVGNGKYQWPADEQAF